MKKYLILSYLFFTIAGFSSVFRHDTTHPAYASFLGSADYVTFVLAWLFLIMYWSKIEDSVTIYTYRTVILLLYWAGFSALMAFVFKVLLET